MAVVGKKNIRALKNKKIDSSTMVVVKTRIAAKDTLFPEKVARAKEILSKTKFL